MSAMSQSHVLQSQGMSGFTNAHFEALAAGNAAR
jgi:hypothetical protein